MSHCCILSLLHLLQGSPDNRTCILVCFPGGPPGLARRKELELDAALGRRVAALCSSAQEPPSLNKVFRTLASEDIPDLPPGGGLYCMAAVIAEAYSQLFQAPGQRWVKVQNGAGKATGTHSSWALDFRPDSCRP
ncbi:probable protein phosphatase 1N [Myotis myotis]|uniref:probable protein phosphatase 1N n=1 Tax=Myotis myotis TaxID=51298 RepID=UPI00174C24C5|nr:probable protein phosphatase 1N [Myotis myotis]